MQAYRKSARQWHPDVNPTEEAKEKFQAINEAYSVRAPAASLSTRRLAHHPPLAPHLAAFWAVSYTHLTLPTIYSV